MSYETVEAALQDLLRDTSTEYRDRVTRADWSIIAGGVPHALVLEYGGFRGEVLAFDGPTRIRWIIRVHVYASYRSDIEPEGVHSVLRTVRDAVITRVLTYPRLRTDTPNLDIHLAFPIRGYWGDPQIAQIGDISALHEVVEVEIAEDLDVDLEE